MATDNEFAQAAVKNRFVEADACGEAMAEAGRSGKSLPDILVERGLLTPALVERIHEMVAESKKPPMLGNFELISKIAEGGMGAVYRARQVSLDRIVALKLLPQRLSHDEQFVARFLREARVAAKLNHPNIVTVHEAGEDRGRHYIAMEFIKGKSVGDMLKERGVFPEKEALGIVREVARALEYACTHNMIHRDVKPDNILLAEDGTPKLADLGLARSTADDSTRMTQSGMAMGTPHYISPEQARGETDLDIRTDIYSLGATLYHMVTGKTPFSGTTAAVVITRHLTEAPPPANEVNPDVSEETTVVITKMMAKKRDERYETPAEVLQDLERIEQGEKPRALLDQTLAGLDAKELEGLIDQRKRDTGELKAASPIGGKRPVYLWIAAGAGGALVIAVLALAVFRGGGAPPERTPDEIVASVERMLAEGSLNEAREEVRKARASHPYDSRFVTLQERVEEALKKEEDKRRLADEERKRKEAEAKVRSLLAAARTLRETGMLDEARAKLAQALAVSPEDAEAKLELERVQQAIAAKEAEEEKRRSESERAASYRKWMDEALRLKLGGKLPEAAQAYGEASKYAPPGSREAADAAADCLFVHYRTLAADAEAKGDLAGAVGLYAKALEAKDDDIRERPERLKRAIRVREVLSGAEEALRKGELGRAEEEAKQARPELFPEDIRRLDVLLEAIKKEKACRKALTHARKALQKRAWYDVRTLAGAVLRTKPGDKEALSLLEQAGEHIAIVNSLGMKLVLIPGGTYTLGSEAGEADEAPAHEARLSTFYIGVTEVTNAQYERFRPGHRQERPSDYSRGGSDPVVHVTWKDAVDFCMWLSGREKRSYRLPTEAEWEAAARGSEARVYPWGNDAPDAGGDFRANLGWGSKSLWARDRYSGTAPAGSFPQGASRFGCLDMCGNVWEWCLDRYSRDYYSVLRSGQPDPRGPRSGETRVLKGGGFESDARTARASARGCQKPSVRGSLYGFRVALEGR